MRETAVSLVLLWTLLSVSTALATDASKVLDLDGIDDHGYATSLPSSVHSGDMTVEAWVKTTSTTAGFVLRSALAQSNPQSNYSEYWGWGIYLNDSGGVRAYTLVKGGGRTLGSSISVNDGRWHHIAMVQSSSGQLSLYVDGVLEATAPITYPGVNRFSANDLYIGAGASINLSTKKFYATQFFDGQLSDIRIWSDVRTLSEIQANKDSTLTGSEAGLSYWYSLSQGVAGGSNTGIASLTDAVGSKPASWKNASKTGDSSNFVAFTGEVALANPNLTLAARAGRTDGPAFSMLATSKSPGAITYSSSDDGVATIDSSTGAVTVVAAGTTTITATQAATTYFESATTTATLTINASNSAPTVAGLLNAWGDEDTELAMRLASSAIVADADDDTLTLTIEASAGSFAEPVDVDTLTETRVTAQKITLLGSAADINSYVTTLGNLKYTGAANANGSAVATISVKANDSTIDSNTESLSITLAAINDAPVLDVATTYALPSIAEEVASSSNQGALVDDFVSGKITDVDGSAAAALVLTEIDNTNGVWQYNLVVSGVVNSSNWYDISTTTAQVVDLESLSQSFPLSGTSSAGHKYRLRFKPDTDYVGTATLKFRAWDKTSGSDTSATNTSTTGGTTAFSAAEGVASVTVTQVNDAPTLYAGSMGTFAEDVAGYLALTAFSIDDLEDDDVTLTATVTGGTLGTVADGSGVGDGVTATRVSATQFTLAGSLDDVNSYLDLTERVSYTPPLNESGSSYKVQFSASDGALTSTTVEGTITITAVNDAPVLTMVDDDYTIFQSRDIGGGTETADVRIENGGHSIRWWLGEVATVADVDAAYNNSIAVTSVDNRYGKWQYATSYQALAGAGSRFWVSFWTDIVSTTGSIVDTSSQARIIAQNEHARSYLRFVPNPGTSGTAELKFRAYDDTTGVTSGYFVDFSSITPGGTTPFSANLGTFRIRSTAKAAIGNLAGDVARYIGTDVPLDVGQDATVSDDDSTTVATLNFTISTGLATGDQLDIDTSGAVTLSGREENATVSVDGVAIGTLEQAIPIAEDFGILLNSSATLSAVQKLLRSIVFRNTDTSAMVTDLRTVESVFSGDGETRTIVSYAREANGANTSTVTAASGVTESGVVLKTSRDTAGEALSFFDFTITDAGGDGLPTEISQVWFNITGTTSSSERYYSLKYLLDGDDVTNKAGSYSPYTTAVGFTSVGISVADGTSETYTVKMYLDPDENIRNGVTFIAGIEKDIPLWVVDSTKSEIGSVTAFGAGTGVTISWNARPVLDATESPALTTIEKNAGDDDGSGDDIDDDETDNTNNPGTTVADIVVDGSITDSDASGSVPEAIAVVGVDNTNGYWQFSIDNGATWSDFDAGTGAESFVDSARLLDGAATGALTNRIRYVPKENSTASATITFRAWDKTAGTTGGLADTTATVDPISFSTATDTASIAISGGNGFPSATGLVSALTLIEDQVGGIDLSALTTADADDDTLTLTLTTTLGDFSTPVDVDGVIETRASATQISLQGTAAALNAYLDTASNLRYTPAANAFGSPYATMTVSLSDGTVTRPQGSVAINVTNVNDAPVLDISATPTLSSIIEDASPNSDSFAENRGTPVMSLIPTSVVTDADGTPSRSIVVTSVDNTNGVWQYNLYRYTNSLWRSFTSTTGAIVDITTAAIPLAGDNPGPSEDRIRFVPNANWSGSAEMKFRAWDKASLTAGTSADVSSSGGSTAVSLAEETASITVTAVDDPPEDSETKYGATLTEDTEGIIYGVPGADPKYFSISDVDTEALSAALTLTGATFTTVVDGSVSGATVSVSDDKTVLTATGTAAQLNAYLNVTSNYRVTPTLNLNGTGVVTVAVNVSDGTSNPTLSSVSGNVTAVNDAPVLTSSSRNVGIKENSTGGDGVIWSSLADMSAASDVDTDDEGDRIGLSIVEVDSTNGEWQYRFVNDPVAGVGSTTTDWLRIGPSGDAVFDMTSSSLNLFREQAAGRTPWVRFVPDESFVGSAVLKVRAWDTSYYTVVSSGDSSVTGGSSDYSTGVGTYSAIVADVKYDPVITNLAGNSSNFYLGEAPVKIDVGSDAGVSDRDPTSYNLGNLTISVTTNGDATEDLLSFDTSGLVALAGTSAGSGVSVSGTVIGTLGNAIAEGNALVVNFNSSAASDEAQALIRAATYTNTDTDSPSTAKRTITVAIDDGDGGVASVDNLYVTPVGYNGDATLSAAAGVVEPVDVPILADSLAEAVDVLDFTITDGGLSDGVATSLWYITLDASGTFDSSGLNRYTWLLNGPDVVNKVGNVSGSTIRFSANIVIADGDSETYTVSVYNKSPDTGTDNETIILSLSGTSAIGYRAGTRIAESSSVNNGTGSRITVDATELRFTSSPSASTSGVRIPGVLEVSGTDELGNIDTDYTESISLSSSSAGTLSGDLSVSAVSGVARFSNAIYTATEDRQVFSLTADDQDEVGANFAAVTSSTTLTANVVATKLAFTQEPVLRDLDSLVVIHSVDSLFSMAVSAVDDNDVLDSDFTGSITFRSINGAGYALITLPSVARSSAPSKNAVAGVLSAAGPSYASLRYYNATDAAETFNLQASASGLASAVSAQFMGVYRDTSATITAADGISEPVAFPTSAVSIATAVPVMDFTVSDGGVSGGDNLPVLGKRIQLQWRGTATNAERAKVSLLLNGPGVENVAIPYVSTWPGYWSSAYTSLFSVPDGGTATYTISAYFNSDPELTAGTTLTLEMNGKRDIVVGGSGTAIASGATVTSEIFGSSLSVTATQLRFLTEPAGAVSGQALATQPRVAAVDAFGNIDTSFTETLTLSEASAGTLTGDLDVTAVNGVATFTDLVYTATADGEAFVLTANDEDGVGTNLSAVASASVTADVVATKLLFSVEPSPLRTMSGQEQVFTTVPVVRALNSEGLLDAGFTSAVTLSEVSGAGSAVLAVTGDTDGSGATASVSAVGGVATFTGFAATYTNAATANEVFALRASSGALTTVDSASITSVYPDGDGSLVAAAGVLEPVAIDSTLDELSEAVGVFDFTLADGGGADGLGLAVSALHIHVAGTSSDAERAKLTWLLSGPGVSASTGVYNAASDRIEFSGLGIDLASGAGATYTLRAYYNDNSGLTEGKTLIFSIDGDTDLTFIGSTIGSSTPVGSGSGSRVSIVATKLVFTSMPAGTTAGAAFTTMPAVAALDAYDNVDTDFTEVITLGESSAGTLGGDIDVAAVAGVATFTDVSHKPAADGETLALTADDESDPSVGSGTDLAAVTATAFTSDVIATKLAFLDQPTPRNLVKARTTVLTTVPRVGAVNADGVVDVGFTGVVTLAEVNGAGSVEMTVTGDTDGNSATATLALSAGVASFSEMSIKYTNLGASNETFNLQASLAGGALPAILSAQMQGVVADTDAGVAAAGGVAEPVDLPTTATSSDDAVALFDFELSDGASLDDLPLIITGITIPVAGTTTDVQRGKISWLLGGPDLASTDAEATGVYDADNDVIAFSGLTLSIASGVAEVYTLSAYFNDNSGISDNATLVLNLDGDTDITVDAAGTLFGTTATIDNLGSGLVGSELTVTATQLSFAVEPAGSASSAALTTQPVVHALDAAGNLDTDFVETLTLTPVVSTGEVGSLSGGVTVAAVGGVGTFVDVGYVAAADKQRVTLSVDDDASVASDLAAINSAGFDSEVTASTLGFASEPSSFSIYSGETVTLSPAFEVAALGVGGAVDIDFVGSVTLAVVGGTGVGTLSIDGDTDIAEDSVTLPLTRGAVSFAGLRLTYVTATAAEGSFRLEARSSGLARASSSLFTVARPPPPADPAIRDEVDGTGRTIRDPEIKEGGELSGGTVCGDAKSAGKISDVSLCKGATITGGSIGGEIEGDATAPATLSGVTVLPGSKLANVHIEADVVLLRGVIIGDNVTFSSLFNMPSGIEFTSLFDVIEMSGREGKKALDLRGAALGGSSAEPGSSYLDIIKTAPEFSDPSTQMQQRADGEVVMELGDTQSRLVPIRAYKTDTPGEDDLGFGFDEDGYLSIRTNASVEIVMYPMFIDAEAVEVALEKEHSEYRIDYSADADFSITRETKVGIEATLPRYVGRPGLSAGRIVTRPLERPLGLYSSESTWLKNVGAVSMITRDSSGELLEQELVPTPADWVAFKARVVGDSRASSVRLDPRGVITISEPGGGKFYVMADYEVTPNAAAASSSRAIVFTNAGDVNGDGEDDYYCYYPNGDRQLLYVFPR